MYATLNNRSLIPERPSSPASSIMPSAVCMPTANSRRKSTARTASDTKRISPHRGSNIVSLLKGFEFALPQRKHIVRVRPLGTLALLLLPCAVMGSLIMPHSQQIGATVTASVNSSVKTVSHSVAAASNYVTDLYRAPILRQGVVYDDTLKNDWVLKAPGHQNTITLKGGSKIIGPYKGDHAIRVRFAHSMDGLRLKVPPAQAIELGNYSQLKLAINGGTVGHQHLFLRTEVDGKMQKTVSLNVPASETWKKIKLPLSQLTGTKGHLTGITIFAEKPQPVFFVDDLHFE